MIPLAYLIMDDDPPGLFESLDLGIAFLVCTGLSALWLAFALVGKRKGKPLDLPYGFWCLAGPGWLGLTGLLISVFENSVASIIILILAIGLPVLLVLKRRRPNQPPLPTPGKCPPSNHDQVPGAADL